MSAKLLIIIGIVLIIIGLILHYFGNVFSWFGNLPGDIKVKRDNFSLYFPLTSMILVSILLNLLIKLYLKFQ
jgi:hypothetical protein